MFGAHDSLRWAPLQLSTREYRPAAVCLCVCLQVTFQLTRVLTDVDKISSAPDRLAQLLAAGQDPADLLQHFADTRQPLEWVIKQVRRSYGGWPACASKGHVIFFEPHAQHMR
jgi:hypothetical protein